jgi:pimeloyl-ACP methyl ester carboxylesterase
MSARLNVRRTWHRARGRGGWNVPAVELRGTTSDGVALAVTRLGTSTDRAVVVAHSLLGYRTKPPWKRLSEALAERFTVYAVDLRGHGDSGGECAGGPLEGLDVRAVVEQARRDGFTWVGTVGGSLGGAAVIFEAASTGSSDLVCAISPPARWVRDTIELPTADGGVLRARLLKLFNSRGAQSFAAVAFGVRMSRRWIGNEPPLDVAHRIAPRPFLVIHDEHDHLFPASTVRELIERAGEPKQLWMRDGFGHCEDGFDDAFCRWLGETLERAAIEGLPVEGRRLA